MLYEEYYKLYQNELLDSAVSKPKVNGVSNLVKKPNDCSPTTNRTLNYENIDQVKKEALRLGKVKFYQTTYYW